MCCRSTRSPIFRRTAPFPPPRRRRTRWRSACAPKCGPQACAWSMSSPGRSTTNGTSCCRRPKSLRPGWRVPSSPPCAPAPRTGIPATRRRNGLPAGGRGGRGLSPYREVDKRLGEEARPHSPARLGAHAHRLVETQHRPGRVPELRRDGPAHARPGHRRGEVPRRRARPARLRHRVDRHGCRAGVSPSSALSLPLLHARRGPLRPAMPRQPGPAAADRRGGGGGAIEDPQRQRQPAARACPDGERQMSQYKIWFQGATDRVQHAPYINKVEPHLKALLDPEFTGTFNTTTPPATTTHAVTEFRIARTFIRNALEAERQGYDAIAITHFQDAGLAEAKAVVDIPVLGLGETTLLHACTLGRN